MGHSSSFKNQWSIRPFLVYISTPLPPRGLQMPKAKAETKKTVTKKSDSKATKPTSTPTESPKLTATAKAKANPQRDNDLLQRALGMPSSLKGNIASQDEYIIKNHFQNTGYPGINLILSGDALNGGMTYGVTVVAGPSKHAKTIIGLLALAQWQIEHPNGIAFLYNNEFGINQAYLDNCGVDTTRVIHVPFTTIEDAKNDIAIRLDGKMNEKGKCEGGFDVGDEVFWFMDSIGNAASDAESDKAQMGKSTGDMGSRAKAIRSFFRVLTPKFNIKKQHFVVVGGSLDTLEEYSKRILSGGGGAMLAADNVLMMFRSEVNEKEKNKDLTFARGKANLGYRFVIFSDKSRFVKERMTIPFDMYWDGGPVRWGGFDELGVMLGVIESVNRGSLGTHFKFDPANFGHEGEVIFCPSEDKIDKSTGELTLCIDKNDQFWETVFAKSDFGAKLTKYYKG